VRGRNHVAGAQPREGQDIGVAAGRGAVLPPVVEDDRFDTQPVGTARRDLQELIRKAKQPVARLVEAHDLHARILTAFKRLAELVTEGGGQLVVILVGHPKLRNGLKRPLMKGKIGDRTTVFEFGGLRALLANQYPVTCWRGQGAGSVAVRQAPTFPG
jgi:hypothetical protein